MASSVSRHHDHTQTHHIRQDNSGRVISPPQRPLPEHTQHSQETDVHASGGIRIRNPSKPRLRPRSALKDLYCVMRDSQCEKQVDCWDANDWYIYSEFINRSAKLGSLEKWLFLASVTCIHLKTVIALPSCGSYGGVHSETDGRIGTRKSAETIVKVLTL